MKQKILSAIAASCLWVIVSTAQTGISGKVSRSNSDEAVAGASIRVKGNSLGVMTDSFGFFRLTVASLPVTLVVSHMSYQENEITITKRTITSIELEPRFEALGDVTFRPPRGGAGRVMKHTGTISVIGQKLLQSSPTTSSYDIIPTRLGFDVNTSSLTMKTPSSRGFNGSGSTRVNQLIDGMDNQAPGLNFFVGNFTGPTELDIESIEVLPGASSALYGPGGMNGTILINSKSPFKYPGLSASIKQGIMNIDKKQRSASAYNDYSLRWATAFNKKFAAKIGVQYISANDWLAGDTSNYLRDGTSGRLISGTRQTDPNYDGVNVYGDETSLNMIGITNLILGTASQQYSAAYFTATGSYPSQAQINTFLDNNAQTSPFYKGLNMGLIPDQNVSRTGYHEKDVIDPQTKNIKLNGALHYKINDKLEAILMGNWSTGNTIYTDDNRYSLKGIKIAQYKAELRHKKWFLRSYTTQEDAGEAHSATIAAQYLNEAWKRSQLWYPQYIGAFLAAKGNMAPDAQAHAFARSIADMERPRAGSAQFRHLLDSVRKVPIPNGGLFKEKSQLWMHEGQYMFGDAKKNVEVIFGGNYKKYILDSDGTLFIDTAEAINTYEIGGYAQLTKKLFHDKLTLVASGRFDKNENFKTQFTPRAAALIALAKNHNLRLSYQTAYRFPGNLTQWIRLNVGNVMLLGGLPWVLDYMNVDEDPVIDLSTNAPLEYKTFKPETMRSFELGYKGLINDRLLVDVYGYMGKYKDFIGRIGLFQPNTGEVFSIVVNSANKVKTHGFGLGLDYKLAKNNSLFFNAYSDVITDVPAGFKSYFNAPKYKLNAGFANSGLGKDERLSFSLMMRWQDGFDYEGELANGPVKAFATADAQVSYKFPKIKSQVRLGGTNIFNHYYKNAYAHPEVGGLYYVGFAYNIF